MKLKSLAAEAKIIRQEERRNKRQRAALTEHRRGVVRMAARNTQLAYAFLRGREYKQVEGKFRETANWAEIERLVKKYGVIHDGAIPYAEWQKSQAEQMARLRVWLEGSRGLKMQCD